LLHIFRAQAVATGRHDCSPCHDHHNPCLGPHSPLCLVGDLQIPHDPCQQSHPEAASSSAPALHEQNCSDRQSGSPRTSSAYRALSAHIANMWAILQVVICKPGSWRSVLSKHCRWWLAEKPAQLHTLAFSAVPRNPRPPPGRGPLPPLSKDCPRSLGKAPSIVCRPGYGKLQLGQLAQN
jgi:hypothetical protein